MRQVKKLLGMLGVAALAGALPAASIARESLPVTVSQRPLVSPVAEPKVDPAVRALLVGLAANLLREAAASPDPMTALGDSLDRKILFALHSPEFLGLIDGLIGNAVQEAPSELREPMARFAESILNNMRREMLDGVEPRDRY